MKNYQTIFWSLRFHGRIFFKSLYVEVRRIWQPSDGVICMRWTVHGVPRVPWEAEGTFDGISQYKLDSEGKIYEHAGGCCCRAQVSESGLDGFMQCRADMQASSGLYRQRPFLQRCRCCCCNVYAPCKRHASAVLYRALA
jgi:hypothetical protein